MPRYYFDFPDEKGGFAPDDTGVELPNLESAEFEASAVLAAMGVEVLPGTRSSNIRVRIRDGEMIIKEVVLAIDFLDR